MQAKLTDFSQNAILLKDLFDCIKGNLQNKKLEKIITKISVKWRQQSILDVYMNADELNKNRRIEKC